MTKTPSANMMDCTQVRRWVQVKLDGERIPDDLMGKFQMHLVACRECAKWAAKMHKMVTRVARLREPGPSWGFESRLMRALGLSPVPVWMRWAAGAAIGMAGAWSIAVLLLGQNAISHATQGLTLVPRAVHFGKLLSYLNPNLSQYLPNILSAGSILVGALVIMVVLGVIAARMLGKTKPLSARNA